MVIGHTNMSRSSSPQITSKGCSRGFILCVLYRALDYARQRQMLGHTVQFPFCNEEIRRWLLAAQVDCSISEETYQIGLGGTFYDESDTSTYWTQPQQFCTWWKNNVERKNKFMLLQRDAAYDESDEKQIARAAYCRNAIAISLSIKNNFHRYLPSQGGTNIVQYIIPYPMPTHMTTASFSFSDAVSHMELEPSTQVLQVTRSEEAPAGLISLPPPPPIVQRAKRPYNKKSSQSRLLPPVHPNGVSSLALAPQVGHLFQMPMSMSNPAASCPEFPGHAHTHSHIYPFNPPAAPYMQPHLSLSLPAVTEEATSDSGTDDDSCYKGDVAARSSTSHDNVRVGGKRKASPTTSLSQSKAPTQSPSCTPIKSKSKPRARAQSRSLTTYANTYLPTFPPYSTSYPAGVPYESPPQSYQSQHQPYPNATQYPIISKSPTYSCSASVPADYLLQEYYRIKNEEPFLSTPPSSYPSYEDDHTCYNFKLPEDPFVLELGIDYFDCNSSNGFKEPCLDFAEKESGRSAGVVSPHVDEDKVLFKPINDDSPIQTSTSQYHSPKRSSLEPSCLTPTRELHRLRVPPLYPTNRTALTRQKFSMEVQVPYPDDDYFLVDHLPLLGQMYGHTNKVPFKPHACVEYATPFFSVSRRFEEDLSSLLNVNGSYLPELAEDERNQKSSSDYDDDCVDQHDVMDNVKSANANNNTNNSNNNNNHNSTNNNSSSSTNNNNNSSIIAALSLSETSYTESYPIPSAYMTVLHTQSPVTCRYPAYGSESDPADYSLLDDGDDRDILCFLGYQSLTSRWNTEDAEAGGGGGSGVGGGGGHGGGGGGGSVCEQHSDTERD